MGKRGTKHCDYAQERAKWLDLLVGDDRNSIQRQLSAVAWDLASFETIGEAIRLARREGNNPPKVPPLIVNLLRVGFYANLFVSIRRLVDPRGDVSSLIRILKEMKKKFRTTKIDSLIFTDLIDPSIEYKFSDLYLYIENLGAGSFGFVVSAIDL